MCATTLAVKDKTEKCRPTTECCEWLVTAGEDKAQVVSAIFALAFTYKVFQGLCMYIHGWRKSVTGSGRGLTWRALEKSWSIQWWEAS